MAHRREASRSPAESRPGVVVGGSGGSRHKRGVPGGRRAGREEEEDPGEPERRRRRRRERERREAQQLQALQHLESFYEKLPPGLVKEAADEAKPEDCIPDVPGNEGARRFLARAPTKGLWMPLGQEVKVMQCWRCKRYGHRTGDKECPFFIRGNQRLEQFRVAHEDPMYDLLRETRRHEREGRIQQLRRLLEDDDETSSTTSSSDSSSSDSSSSTSSGKRKRKRKRKEERKSKSSKKKRRKKKRKKKHKAAKTERD
ncbi:retinitis pigmentosa 9 protein [Pogona vitticeps]